MSICPSSAASIKGVQPSLVIALTSAPLSNMNWTSSILPSSIAFSNKSNSLFSSGANWRSISGEVISSSSVCRSLTNVPVSFAFSAWSRSRRVVFVAGDSATASAASVVISVVESGSSWSRKAGVPKAFTPIVNNPMTNIKAVTNPSLKSAKTGG